MLHAKRPALRGYFSSDADLDDCLASGDWRAAFADVPGDPSPPSCPASPPPKPPPALQLAFAPAGTDLAHFALQALYEQGGAIFGHDGVNTFNTISREAAADALRACPATADLLPAYRLKYGRLRSLRYHRQPFTADGAVVHSCLGPQQGCTWGTLVCALVHQRALTLAALRHPGSTVLGFADDAHVHNSVPQHAYSSLLLLRHVLKERTGVEHNDKGGCIAAGACDISFAPASFPGSPHHPEGARRAYSALGGFIGPPDVVSAALCERVLSLDRDIDGCRFLIDSPACRYALQARLRLIRDCACHAVTHLLRAHPPAVSLPAAALHDKLIRHAVFHGLAPPPDSPPAAVQRAAALLHLPARLGGHGFTSAVTTAPAAFFASALQAFATLRPLHPHFSATDLLSDTRPIFSAIRAAHADLLRAHSSVSHGYDALASSAPYVDAFGDSHTPFHPVGLPCPLRPPPPTPTTTTIRLTAAAPTAPPPPLPPPPSTAGPSAASCHSPPTWTFPRHATSAPSARSRPSSTTALGCGCCSLGRRATAHSSSPPPSAARTTSTAALSLTRAPTSPPPPSASPSSTTSASRSPAWTPPTPLATSPSALLTTPPATRRSSPPGTTPRSPPTPPPVPSANPPSTPPTPRASGPTSTSPTSIWPSTSRRRPCSPPRLRTPPPSLRHTPRSWPSPSPST